MKKIVVSVISTDQVPELGDELREKCDESLAEFNVDIYHVIKKFGPVLAQMGVQQNHEKNLFLNETDSDFCISHPVYATPLRDFSTLVDAVNKEGIFEDDKEDAEQLTRDKIKKAAFATVQHDRQKKRKSQAKRGKRKSTISG